MSLCAKCNNLLDDDGNCYECIADLIDVLGRKEMNTAAKPDNVNNPPHYGQGSIECIDYIKDFLNEDEYVGYLRGNIAKYLHRWRHKNGLEDLKKAQWYLSALIQEVSKK